MLTLGRTAPRIVSGRHLPKFLTAFPYGHPALRAIAIEVHFRVEPARVIEGAGFDKSKVGHDGHVGRDRRPTLGTKIPTNRLAAVPGVIERLTPFRHRRTPVKRHQARERAYM